MAFVKYTGIKKNFGPLKKKWMNEPIVFDKNNISNEIDKETADAIILSMPKLFIRSAPPVQDVEPDQEEVKNKKPTKSLKLKVKPVVKKKKKKKVGTKLTSKHIK